MTAIDLKKKKSTVIHQTRADNIFDVVNVLLLGIVLLLVLYPLIFVLSCSFSDPLLVVQSKIILFPKQLTLVAYERVFRNELIVSGYKNTILYTVLGTAINVAITTATAYPLSRKDFKARKPITIMITFTMLFSGGMIPTFLVVKQLGLLDSIFALLLPGAMSTWNMFIMKNYFQSSIPGEMYEAARIDGASNMRILTDIVLPLSAPIIAVMVLYYGVGHWNSYFNALIYIYDNKRYPLQLVMRSFFNSQDYAEQGAAGDSGAVTALLVAETMKYALIVVSSAPVLALYPFLQRYFVKGVMIGAVKG